MGLYRVHRPLSGRRNTRIAKGTIDKLEWLSDDGKQALIDAGAISIVSTPPLSILPGWKSRAAKLVELNLDNVGSFIESDVKVLAKALRVKPETVTRWQRELTDSLLSSPAIRPGG